MTQIEGHFSSAAINAGLALGTTSMGILQSTIPTEDPTLSMAKFCIGVVTIVIGGVEAKNAVNDLASAIKFGMDAARMQQTLAEYIRTQQAQGKTWAWIFPEHQRSLEYQEKAERERIEGIRVAKDLITQYQLTQGVDAQTLNDLLDGKIEGISDTIETEVNFILIDPGEKVEVDAEGYKAHGLEVFDGFRDKLDEQGLEKYQRYLRTVEKALADRKGGAGMGIPRMKPSEADKISYIEKKTLLSTDATAREVKDTDTAKFIALHGATYVVYMEEETDDSATPRSTTRMVTFYLDRNKFGN